MKKPILRSVISGLLAFALVFGTVTIAPTRSSAASLSTSIIGMFPKSVGEFAYADLKAARKFPWFSQLYGQVLPPKFRQFEQFLGSSGVDPNSQVEEIAWANISSGSTDDMVGIALGQFDPSAVETKLKAQKVPHFEVQGYHLYAFGSGAAAGDILFVFFDSSTAAFGNRAVLEHLINVRMGGEETPSHRQAIPADLRSQRQRHHLGRAGQRPHAPRHAATGSASRAIPAGRRHHRAPARDDHQHQRG